jgi:hypothetical protein
MHFGTAWVSLWSACQFGGFQVRGSCGSPGPCAFSFLIPFWVLSIGFLRVARVRSD